MCAHYISQKLLDWYDQNHRLLPWRIDPLSRQKGLKPNPYHVWLSEIMLQQTTVATVKSYFNKFITLWPDIEALSAASLEAVLQNWAGLGYYARARNLKKTADIIAKREGGRFPDTYEALRALPGIGDYTAAAIMAIVHDAPYPAIDGNVERIITRMEALEQPKQAAKKHIQAHVGTLMPHSRSGDFAQSLMDLGAMICRPLSPDCPTCPWQEYCQAFKQGTQTKFPLKTIKKQKPHRSGIAFVIRSKQGRIFLQKRGSKGLLAGMSEVPNHFAINISKQALEYAPFEGAWRYQGEITHIFTHFRLEMAVYSLDNIEENCDHCHHGWWVATDRLKQEALPSLMQKILKQVTL